MAFNQDMYDTLTQYFQDNPIDFSTNSTFDGAFQMSMDTYFQNNPFDIDFSTNNTFDSACRISMDTYFQNHPISVDLSSTNTKIDNVKTVVDSVKTKVDTNLDAKISSVGSNSVDLSATNSKIDAVKTVADSNSSLLSNILSDIVNLSQTVFYDANSDTTLTLKMLLDAINQGCDLSNVSYVIDGSNLDLSSLDLSSVNYSVDVSTLDLTSVSDSVVAVISQNVQDFISSTSLDGSSGSLYFDGADVLVDGDNRVYTVLGSQILTTIGGQADYFYVLQDNQGRKMLTVQDNISLSV